MSETVALLMAFGAGAFAATVTVWFTVDAHYSGRVDTLNERVSLHRDEVSYLRDRLHQR